MERLDSGPRWRLEMKSQFEHWLDELEHLGVVKRREDVLDSMIVLGCILGAAGIVFLILAWRR